MNDALKAHFDDKTYLMNILSHMGVDVAEVVRCKDCKYKDRKRCGLTGYTVRAHDYCSYGERKEKGKC